ncbi:DNA primase [Pelotomaculum propionicicum]|uniref:DNA primase n=1 Tax=Pelotomaculum propionicicum TaxID=258475 RepID=UPI003B807BE4
MGFIPDEIIETVRLRSDILHVVSRHVQLKKKGKNYTGSCPFHDDRTPSFTVTPDKQIFHCFGCNVGGDVFKFLMLKEGLTFFEAVKTLAEQAGIVLPADDSPAAHKRDARRESLKQINNLAKDFFIKNLQHYEAAAARNYLQGRGLSPEVLERFQIGFALPGWQTLLEYLGKKGFQQQDIVEAGLAVIKAETGRTYDRFRNRVMFPIWDAAGRVVGFGGRVLDDTLPKYLNSPETAFFSKSRTLYGLYQARQHIREKGYVVVVEGYMDVITAHQYGAANTVASLGTALTVEHGRILMNYSRNVIIAYDADAAGVAATIRGLDILQDLGCEVSVVSVPDGKDPDDYLRRYGVEPWEELIRRASSLIEYKLRHAAGKGNVRTVAEKLEVMRQVFPSLASKGGVEREEGLKKITRALNLSWETVAGELKRFEENLSKKWTDPDKIVKNTHTIIRKEEKFDARGKSESVLLRLVLEDPSLAETIRSEIGEVPFKNHNYQRIFKNCLELYNKPGYRPEGLFNILDNDDQNLLSHILTLDIPGENPIKILKSYIDSINRCIRQERREEILEEIRDLEKSGNSAIYNDLLRELVLLKGIDEAEKAGDQDRAAGFLNEYKKLFNFNNGNHLREGRDSI